MYFLGDIEVFLVLGVWFVGAVNATLRIVDLILYMICWSLKEINIFFLWGEPGMHVDKYKVWNHVYWQFYATSRAINPCKGEVPLIFGLRGRYWKIMVERWYNIWNLSRRSLYQARKSSFLMAVCETGVLQKTLNSDSTLSLRISQPPEEFLFPPQSID